MARVRVNKSIAGILVRYGVPRGIAITIARIHSESGPDVALDRLNQMGFKVVGLFGDDESMVKVDKISA